VKELTVGREYILTNEDGGIMAVEVRELEPGNHVAMLFPTDPAMRAWYCAGYRLGRAHWDRLTPVHRLTP
jgi:hypothetical protein